MFDILPAYSPSVCNLTVDPRIPTAAHCVQMLFYGISGYLTASYADIRFYSSKAEE